MSDSIPTFGEKQPEVDYVVRHGVYAVIFDSGKRVAAVRGHGGLYLPGGGSDSGETPKQTLVREIREECGVDIQMGAFLGEAVDYLYASGEKTHFEKHGLFYRAIFLTEPVSPDLFWISLENLPGAFRQESHVWAIEAATNTTR